MQMASNDIRLETKHYRFLAMNLHSLKKEMFVAADLVLIKISATKISMSIFEEFTMNIVEYGLVFEMCSFYILTR